MELFTTWPDRPDSMRGLLPNFDKVSRFIVLEGNEGVGKTTVAHILQEELRLQGFHPVLFNQPGTTPLGLQVRSLLGSMHLLMSPVVKMRLLQAARHEGLLHFKEILRKDPLAVVIGDRHEWSTEVLQLSIERAGLTPGVFAESRAAQEANSSVLNPDMILYLDCPVSVSKARVDSRGEASKHMFDFASNDQMESMLQAYRLQVQVKNTFYGSVICPIDTSGDVQDTMLQVRPLVTSYVELLKTPV